MSKRQKYEPDWFVWSEQEFTMKEMIENFTLLRPFVILVTQGYSGRDTVHTIGADEIYWIQDIVTQSRLVVQNTDHQYFSIPEACSRRIVPMKKSGYMGPPMTVKEMIGSEYSSFYFEDENQSVYDGAADSTRRDLGFLEIIDVFDEKFLVGHTLLSEPIPDPRPGRGHKMYKKAISPTISLIPVYMPVVVAIALKVYRRSDRTFFKVMKELKDNADCLERDDYTELLKQKEFSEIMAFPKNLSGSDYGYIEVLSLSEVSQHPKTNDEQTSDSDCPIYEEIQDVPKAVTRRVCSHSNPIVSPSQLTPESCLANLQKIFENGIPEGDSSSEEEADVFAENPVTGCPPIPPKGRRVQISRSFSSPYPHYPLKKPPLTPKLSEGSIPPTGPLRSQLSMRVPRSDMYEEWKLPVKTSSHGSEGRHPETIISARRDTPQDKGQREENPWKIGTSGENDFVDSCPSTIRSLADIPDDIAELGVDDLVSCLTLLNLSQYAEQFKSEQISGKVLQDVNIELLQGYGFKKFDAVKLISFAQKGWRPSY